MDNQPVINDMNMSEYRKIFGSDKMQHLWQEFLNEAYVYLKDVEFQEAERQQICFHNLRAYALVFDMYDFMHYCTEMEEKILTTGPISADDAKQARDILETSIQQVEQKLAG